jgi:hypothetical protein
MGFNGMTLVLNFVKIGELIQACRTHGYHVNLRRVFASVSKRNAGQQVNVSSYVRCLMSERRPESEHLELRALSNVRTQARK